MEELQPQDIEDLLQELEEEGGTQESPPHEVEELLQVLQSGGESLARRNAAEQLGSVAMSSARIVRALIAAYESDPSSMVNRAAARSLRAPVHQEYLQQHPDLMELTERALLEVPGPGVSMVLETSDEDTAVAFAQDQILFEAQDGTTQYTWQPARVQLSPEAGVITIIGSRDGRPTITIPVSEITSCEIVERQDIPRDTSRGSGGSISGGSDLGDLVLGLLLVVFLAVFETIIEDFRAKKTKVPVLRLTQARSDDSGRGCMIDLRSDKRGDKGRAATLEMAHRIVAFLRLAGYGGTIPKEVRLPKSPEALVKEVRASQEQRTRSATIDRCLKWGSIAGLVVGLLVGWQHVFHLESHGCESPDFKIGPLVGLLLGAVVGAALGAAVERRKNRREGIITGAVAAAVVASIVALVVRFALLLMMCYW